MKEIYCLAMLSYFGHKNGSKLYRCINNEMRVFLPVTVNRRASSEHSLTPV
jgi:hypothetical protein